MKKLLLFCLFCLLPLHPAVGQPLSASTPGEVEWQAKSQWKMDAKPLDMVHTLDNQKVYILGDDQKVHVFSTEGQKLGSVPVDKGVTAIDIAPRGELLYLINGQEKTFTSLAVSFVTPIDVSGSPFLGREDAPVVLAVFSDFQ